VHPELWQQQKQQLASALQEKILADRERAVYRDLLAEDLPEFFQVYLRNQARKIFQEDKPIRLRASERYDFEDPDLKRQLVAVRETIIKGTVFTREELSRVIEASVSIQFDVLVRPRQTMEEMLFRNHSERECQDVVVIVQGFGEDRPFVRELLAELRSRDNDRITAEEFHRLATEVEDRIYAIKPISTFLQELTSYLEFTKKITGIERDAVSGATVTAMLKERRLDDLAAGLQHAAQSKQEWPLNEIEAALERILLTRGLEGEEKVSEVEEELPGEIDLEEAATESTLPLGFEATEDFAQVADEDEDEVSSRAPAGQPKIKFVDETPVVSEESARSAEEDESREEPQGAKTQPTILFPPGEETLLIDRDTIEKQPPGPYPPLHSLIDARSRKMIMKKIFRKNKEEYVAFVEKLERVESWKEAKSLIDLELHRRGISPYSKEAVRLGDILFSRYFSRSRR
jgi:hypothetical protein